MIRASSFLHTGRVGHVAARSHTNSPWRHATGAMGPSVTLRISPTVYESAGLASLYPPPLPWVPVTKPASRRLGIMVSRYFKEICCLSAISFSGTRRSPLSERSIITRSAYLPLVETR